MNTIYLIYQMNAEGADVVRSSIHKLDCEIFISHQEKPEDYYSVELDVTKEIYDKTPCLWAVEGKSANYAGGGETLLVWALHEDQARELAEADVEAYWYEQDYDQVQEEMGDDYDDCYGTIDNAEEAALSQYADCYVAETGYKTYDFVN